MHESTQLSFLTILSLLAEMLTRVSFILIWVVQPLKSGVRVLAVNVAPEASVRVIVFALFSEIIKLVRRSTIVKRFMSVDTMIPIMIF